MIAPAAAHFRARLVTGLLIVLPLLVTLWLLRILFKAIDANVTPWIFSALSAAGVPDLDRWPARLAVPIVGVVLTVFFIYGIGLLAGNLVGRRLLELFEGGVLRIPLVKGIYGSARQLMSSFSVTSKRPFSKVVLVEFPREKLWAVGFVTQESEHPIARPGRGALPGAVPVFVPTTPNPTSGYVVFAARDQLVELDITVEQGLKLVVSGGIVSPDRLAPRTGAAKSGP